MELIRLKYGKVRSFQTAFTGDVEAFSVNPKCRSFRIRNTGNDDATLLLDGISEPLAIGDSITYGGYNDSFRNDVLSFEFAGVGLLPKIIISQDVQQTEPIYFKDNGTLEDC